MTAQPMKRMGYGFKCVNFIVKCSVPVTGMFIIFIFFLHAPVFLNAHIHTCFQFCDREEIVSRTEKELLRSELNRCIEKVQKAHTMRDPLIAHFLSHLTLYFTNVSWSPSGHVTGLIFTNTHSAERPSQI